MEEALLDVELTSLPRSVLVCHNCPRVASFLSVARPAGIAASER